MGMTFAESESWTEKSIPEIAKKIAALPKEGSKPRTVVITQGKDPSVVVVNGEVTDYPVIELPKEKLKDTNGAGDSYVGGFLAGLARDEPSAEGAAYLFPTCSVNSNSSSELRIHQELF